MPTAASESPIAISSASPTPERPSLRPGRRSSSSIIASTATATATAGPSTRRPIRVPQDQEEQEQDIFTADSEEGRSIQPLPRRGVDRRAQPFVLVPTARAFRPASSLRRDQGLAIPSRTASPATSNATHGSAVAGDVIDLTEEDDDDVVEVTRVNEPPPPPPPRARRNVQNGPIWRDLRRIDEIAAERGAAVRGILNDPDIPRRRQFLSPSPIPASAAPAAPARAVRAGIADADDDYVPRPAAVGFGREIRPVRPRPEEHRPRIGFGGAVLRQGDRQINYNQPQARPQANGNGNGGGGGGYIGALQQAVNNLPPRRVQGGQWAARANLDEEINERIQRRIRERDDGGYAGMADMLNGLMDRYGMEGIFAPPGPAGRDRVALMERVRRMRAEHNWGGAGPAGMANQRRQDDPQTIIAQVPKFDYPPSAEGYTSNFEIDSTIEIDQPASSKRYLACVYCAEPLLLSSGYKTPADRVWALRCGHLIDQKCLEKLSTPQSEDDRASIAGLPVLGEDEMAAAGAAANTRGGGRKAKKAKPNTRKTPVKPVEYEWTCPAKKCGHLHKSALKDAEWTQVELEGALQMYA